MPRFQGENLRANLALVDALGQVAQSIDATVAQVAIAWVASRGPDLVPLVGARSRDRLAESVAAADLVLNEHHLAAIEAAVPAGSAAGNRYPSQHMAKLDSERDHRYHERRTTRMFKVVAITGAGTGMGRLTARNLR
uniref:aldo/keto reductase n=1 Tax=Micromonospora acroterricola TaxID=2202421 RepID=UPI001F477326|nr:aldo/keto reductase [Micromonospora acroterricola]